MNKGKDKKIATDHQNLRPFAIVSFPSPPLTCCVLQKQSATYSAAASSRSTTLAGEPCDPAPGTYCERSVLRAGRGRALLSMRLRASVERQIVLAGLACIVLSVWHPVLCGNPVLWGWRKWDCGEWLHHCIRSCCWLLVTLEKGKSRRRLYYTMENRWKHHPEKLSTNTLRTVHVNIPPTAAVILHHLLLSSLSKRARLAPPNYDTGF